MSHSSPNDAPDDAARFGDAELAAEDARAVSLAHAERERVWAERIRAGDASAFEALFHAYAPRMVLTVSRYVDSIDVAEDLVQEIFLRIWRARETWHVTAGVGSYLMLAARNQAINSTRHAHVVRRFRDREAVRTTDDAADTGDALARLARAEDAAAVERAFAALPDKQRQVCELRWRDQLSCHEIGDRLGISVRTVENQISRAIRRIRHELGDRD